MMRLRPQPRFLATRPYFIALLLAFSALTLSACNLGAAPPEPQDITQIPTNTLEPTRTLLPNNNVPTSSAVTQIPIPTQPGIAPTAIQFPTSVPAPTSVAVLPPTATPRPTATDRPISVLILSPLPGSILSGNVQILGSASHPQFMQYRVEFGPQPNPNNLWFPITGVVQTPVFNGTLGIWNTTTAAAPDGNYQMRLRVILRDGRQLTTVVNNLRVQNQEPTPIPTDTPPIPRPTAAFTADRTSGPAPLVVRFTNQSQGQITSLGWEFGDGGSSTQRNPVHTFQEPGVYTVTLRVIGPGGSANVSRQINVTSPQSPVAGFSANPTSGTSPLTVNFTNASTGNITGYTWNFGDGETSTAVNPTHTFTDVGNYNVILEAMGPGGTSTVVRQITVENPQVPPPEASFDPSTRTGVVPLSVSFTNTTQGEVDTYLWDFNGDGITDSTAEDPSHIYNEAATYDVVLRAIGPGGQSSATVTITANNPPEAPVANFNAQPVSGDAPLTVSFTDQTTGNVTSYSWDFNNDGMADSTAANPSFTYQEPGTYTAVLTVSGPGGSTTAQTDISVTTPLAPPEAGFVPDPSLGTAPLSVDFINQSSGEQLTYAWDFNNDGVTDSAASNPSFTYENPGLYTVMLTVNNPAGSDTASAQINVSEEVVVLPPTAAFQPSASTVRINEEVSFNNQSVGDITGYQWDFQSDGTIDSTEANPSHTYTTPGTYTVTLTASGPGGDNSVTSDIEVLPALAEPVASFSAQPNPANVGQPVSFNNASTGEQLSYQWDFNGDGTFDSTEAAPTFTYPQAGTFTVRLVVSNPAGTAEASADVTVNEPLAQPVASFSAQPNPATVGQPVSFNNASTGEQLSYQWDFNGDGTFDSTEAAPTFTYPQAGTFTVRLVVSNPAGTAEASADVTVNEPLAQPVASFSAQPNPATVGQPVTFNNASTGEQLTFQWDFNGDGTFDSTEAAPTFTYPQAGTFTVRLVVSNPAGTAEASADVTVNEPLAQPVASFSAQPNPATVGQPVTFNNASTGEQLSYQWDFNGDGTFDSTEAAPTFAYGTPGLYTVTLSVSNPAGTSSAMVDVAVNPAIAPPTAAFTAEPNPVSAGTPVNFLNQSTGEQISFQWDFQSDGTVDSTEANPSFSYAQPGTYTATLTVTNPAGSASANVAITVNAALSAPQADFTPNPNPVMVNEPVSFNNQTVGEQANYQWDFNGDGLAESTEANPSFTYAEPGTYTATLTATNPAGSDTVSVVITVEAPAQPAPSVDGPLAFVTDRDGNNDIYVMGVDGSNPVNVTNHPGNDRHPVWSPDGTQIAFTSDRDGGDDDIYVLTVADLSVTRLTTEASNESQPVWSPDGTRFALTSDRDGNPNLYRMNADGSGLAPITSADTPEYDPFWLDNNRLLAVFNGAVWTLNADGSDPAQLTEEAVNARYPSLSPDPNAPLIIFASDQTGNSDIYTMNTDGSAITPLTTDPASDTFPAWSPDGARIVFTSDRQGDNDLFTMTPQGAELTQVNAEPSSEFDPIWR